MNGHNYFDYFQVSVSHLFGLELKICDFKLLLDNKNLIISDKKPIDELLIFLAEILRNICTLEGKVKTANLAISARSSLSFDREFKSLYFGSFSVISLCDTISKIFDDLNLNFEEERSKLDDLYKKLVSLNEVIKNILENSAWNSIAEVELRNFTCNNVLATTYQQAAYSKYNQIAKGFDLESESFIDIENHILKPVNRVFIKNDADDL